MRVRDKELERRIVRRAKPSAYSEGDNVSAHLARIEREASSFNELAQKGRVPPLRTSVPFNRARPGRRTRYKGALAVPEESS